MSARDQAAGALADVLRNLPDPEAMVEAGLTPVIYIDHLAGSVFFTVNGVHFQAVVEPV